MVDKTVFDMDALLNATCDDRELAGQVVGVFLNDIPLQLKNLDKAIAERDVKTTERVTHSIKGASATVGGETLRALALECETASHEGRLDAVQANLLDLNRHYENLKAALLEAGFTAE